MYQSSNYVWSTWLACWGNYNLPMKSTQSSQKHNKRIQKCIYFSFTVTSSKLFDSFFPAAVTRLFHAEHVVHWKSHCLQSKNSISAESYRHSLSQHTKKWYETNSPNLSIYIPSIWEGSHSLHSIAYSIHTICRYNSLSMTEMEKIRK